MVSTVPQERPLASGRATSVQALWLILMLLTLGNNNTLFTSASFPFAEKSHAWLGGGGGGGCVIYVTFDKSNTQYDNKKKEEECFVLMEQCKACANVQCGPLLQATNKQLICKQSRKEMKSFSDLLI